MDLSKRENVVPEGLLLLLLLLLFVLVVMAILCGAGHADFDMVLACYDVVVYVGSISMMCIDLADDV